MGRMDRPLTVADARKVLTWFRDRFGLKDYDFDLVISDDPPEGFPDDDPLVLGQCLPDLRTESVRVWISNGRCLANQESPTRTLFHELLHVLFRKAGLAGDGRDRGECVVNRLAAALEALYLKRKHG